MNPIGMWTLFAKEVRRFSKVWIQTVVSPLVTTALYFLVFGVALGSRLRSIHGLPYMEFVVPGLVLLAMMHNAFANTSSSFLQAKMNGSIQDVLVAPLSASEILGAYVSAAVVRALVVGSLVWSVAALFIGVEMHSVVLTICFAVAVSATSASFGLLAAIQAERFDQVSAIPSFVLTPLTFLGGVFYSLDMLPDTWASLSRANPVLYMVGGLRFGMLGQADVELWQAAVVVLGLLCLSVTGAHLALSRGHRLRP